MFLILFIRWHLAFLYYGAPHIHSLHQNYLTLEQYLRVTLANFSKADCHMYGQLALSSESQ